MVLAPVVVLVRLQLVAGRVIVQVATPSLTVTVPPGAPAPGATGVTVTLTAYASPITVGVVFSAAALAMVVVVFALLTVCGAVGAVLDWKLASPA